MERKLTAIVSLYNPQEENVRNVEQLARQADSVILCDNSSVNHVELFEGMDVIYVPNLENLGLSMAFNKVLKDPAFGWDEEQLLIFFDQDSSVGEGHIRSLKDEYELLSKNHPVGCIGPVFHNKANGTVEIPTLKTEISERSYSVNNIITSSMLTRYKELEEVGFFNEELFLDLVDWDLCWRLREKGYLCVITEKVVLDHCVGSGEKKFGPLKLRVGAPIREYYQTRDALYELRKTYVPMKMRIRLLANVTVRPMIHLMALDHKKERAMYIHRGFKSYRKKEHGEYRK